MVINSFSKTGSYHRGLHKKNQDFLCSIEDKDYLAVMLADGATGCKRGLEGARLSCEAVSQIIGNEGAAFFNFPKGKIAYLLTEHILYRLECNQVKENDFAEYGSTFMLAYMEKKTGRTVLINLGDGAIISANGNGFSYLMRPKKYFGNPCLTTTKGADKAIDIQVENLSLQDRIFLCSDGFLHLLDKGDAAAMLNLYDLEVLNRQLQRTENPDDCSYISFVREKK